MLTPRLLDECINIMDDLMKHPCATLFASPIILPDEDDKEAQQVFASVIKHPVDLKLIRQNLVDNHYKDLSSWENDMKYIWINAEKINKKNICMISLAKELKKQYRKLCKRVKLLTVSKWVHAASDLKDELDALLDSPPDVCSQYATVSIQEEDDIMKSLTESEKSALGRATLYMSSPQDQKRVTTILSKYKTPVTKTGDITTVDINSLQTHQMHELRAYIEKRMNEMGIPYPK